jgi:hypothetical protein
MTTSSKTNKETEKITVIKKLPYKMKAGKQYFILWKLVK